MHFGQQHVLCHDGDLDASTKYFQTLVYISFWGMDCKTNQRTPPPSRPIFETHSIKTTRGNFRKNIELYSDFFCQNWGGFTNPFLD